MVQSIELLLDPTAEAAAAASWRALASAGLPSQAHHTGATNRPHVTLAVTEGAGFRPATEALREVLAERGVGTGGLPAVLGAPMLFGGHRDRWVLVRQVVPSRALLALHAAVHEALDAAGVAAIEQTRPDAWTPHVTLARRVPGDRLGDALAAIDLEPRPCRLEAARLWDSVEKAVTPLVP